MKTTTILLIFALTTLSIVGQNADYSSVMKDKIAVLKTVESPEDLLDLANDFERISAVSSSEWLPYYYAGYCYINLSFSQKEPDKIDAYLDKAQGFLDNAFKIDKKEAELHVLQGFIHQGRIQADPMARGMQYSVKSNESFSKAEAIDPDNPRIYFLLAQNLLYTPEAFGGGAKTACPLFKKANEKFNTFVPDNELNPDWGKKESIKLANQHCSNN